MFSSGSAGSRRQRLLADAELAANLAVRILDGMNVDVEKVLAERGPQRHQG